MRFIILAPILCLLAIVAAYPIQRVGAVEPLTFLQTKEPAGGLTPRAVMPTIKRFVKWNSSYSLTVNWRHEPSVTKDTPGFNRAKKAATTKMMDYIRHIITTRHAVLDKDSISITWAQSRFLIRQLMFITLSVWSLIRVQARGPVRETACSRFWAQSFRCTKTSTIS